MAKQTISNEAHNLHQESIVVDLHIDPIIQQALFGYHLSDEHDPVDYQDFVEYKYSLKLQLMRVNGLLTSVERTVPGIGAGSDILPASSGGVLNETELLNC